MRKLTVILLALMITLCSAVPAFASWKDTIKNTAENTYDAAKQMTSIAKDAIVGGVEVEVNGDKVSFPDQEPFIDSEKNRTYVPLRFVSEALGGEVDWKPEKEIATVERDGKNVEMPIGSNTPTVDGQEKKLDAPAELMNERTVVPLRFVSEALGSEVEWINDERLVKITDDTGEDKDSDRDEDTNGDTGEPEEPIGDTYEENGYTVPEDTGNLSVNTGDTGEDNSYTELDLQIETYHDQEDVEEQFDYARYILESKFDSKDVDEMLDYARQKEDEFDTLDKEFDVDGYEVRVSAAGEPLINIQVWRP